MTENSAQRGLVGGAAPSAVPASEIDASCRLPLLVLFVSAAVWLVIASSFGLIASIKFHQPAFLADVSWLTYGRVRPASFNALLYGFCMQAGLGVGLWIIAHLGRVELAGRWLVTIGAKLWNLGVTVGIIGILAGDNLGYDTLEMPVYAALLLFLGYTVMGLFGLLTLQRRRYFPLYVSQWFLVAAIFWFPWIYTTAYLLIGVFPVRGVTQAVIAWWYAANLQTVWLGAVGLATAFYLVPKITQRELRSRYLALFTFWSLLLFGGWTGIPRSAPLPAWIPALSSSAGFLLIIPLLTVAMNLYATNGGLWAESHAPDSLRFVCIGIAGFLVNGFVTFLSGLPEVARVIDLTWFGAARQYLAAYGFVATILFGAIYYIVPRLTGMQFAPKLVRAHLWVAIAGLVLVILPLAAAGLAQGLKTIQPRVPFNDILHSSLLWLRISTAGDLFLAAGHVILLFNLGMLVRRFCQVRVLAAYGTLTREPNTAGVGA